MALGESEGNLYILLTIKGYVTTRLLNLLAARFDPLIPNESRFRPGWFFAIQIEWINLV